MKNKLRLSGFSWGDVLSCRQELFGITAVWILLFHIYRNIGLGSFPGSGLLGYILSIGNCGVDLFLFLSAIGLCASMARNDICRFYRNRLARVAVPYLIMAVPYFLWYDFGYAGDGLWGFIGNLSTWNFWRTGDHPVWYVAFVLPVYALFPAVYSLDRKSGHLSTVLLLAVAIAGEMLLMHLGSGLYANAEKALSRIPLVLVGILMAPGILAHREIPLWRTAGAAALGLGLFWTVTSAGLHIILTRFCYGAMSICIVMVYAFVRKHLPVWGLNRLAAWLGGMSLELYISHVFLLRIIKYYQLWDFLPFRTVWYLLIPTVAVLTAWGVCRLLRPVHGKKQG